MSVRRLALASLCAAISCASAAHAAPNPYSHLVVFGDSLSDSGQFPDLNGPLGSSLRFTNRVGPTYQPGSGEPVGPTSVMLLGGRLGFSSQELGPSTSLINSVLGLPDGNNWAVGGYRTDQILASITEENGSVVATNGLTLRRRDGYLVDLADQGQRLDSNALYYLTGGGNDFLQGMVTSPATAQTAANQLAASASALQQAGARYIMVWLLPDIGLTPALSGTPQQAAASQLSAVFNNQLVSQLSTIDAQIIPLNVPRLLSEVLADPARYGLAADQNLTATCFDDCTQQNAVYGIDSANPDPTRLLYNDRVHPTITGQRLIADYAYLILAAPWELTLLPEMAYGSLTAHQGQLYSQWLSDRNHWQPVGTWNSFVSPGGLRQNFDGQSSSVSGDGDGYSLDLGGSFRLNDYWRVGVAAGFYKQDLNVGAADSRYDLRSYFATAFAQYQQNHWWADLALTGGHLDYHDLKRTFALGPTERSEKGDTNGHLWAASGRLGFDLAQPQSAWHLSPFISADYARITVDSYSENSDQATALNIDEQKRRSRRLGAGLQGQFELTTRTQVFAEVAREKEFEDSTQDLTMSQVDLPGLSYTLQGYTPSDWLDRASLGVSQQLTDDVAVRASYSYRKSREEDAQQSVGLSVSWQW
ncbi:autotransporter domain-containing protein [Pseudomonas luteola]|uniref:esterase EstP n=1 Tax=Pseudomonas luteola TaxID=47886 RepID=UPI000F7B2F6A|nr:esterase EstP [Pseudomonas luteola]RRW47127.1 autotransporter domain-containing protein [Pseudomonas luteola]